MHRIDHKEDQYDRYYRTGHFQCSFGKLTKGINSVFAQEGYTVVLCESQGELEKELKLLGILEEKQIEGLLLPELM